MSAEILRRAAALMREQFPDACDCAGALIQTNAHEASCATYAADWPRAVADWLDFIAPHARFGDDDAFVVKHALTVARAYLGDQS